MVCEGRGALEMSGELQYFDSCAIGGYCRLDGHCLLLSMAVHY